MNMQYCGSIFLCLSIITWAEKNTVTQLMPHSPTLNPARDLCRYDPHLFQEEARTPVWCTLSFIPQIDRSSRADRISQLFFGDSCLEGKYTFRVAGSRVKRTSSDWLADYDGLPPTYQSEVFLRPRINSFTAISSLYCEYSAIVSPGFMRIDLPIMHTRWDLNLVECIIENPDEGYDPGYFSPTASTRNNLSSSFQAFIGGHSAPSLESIEFQKLRYAKMSPCPASVTHIPEIMITAGLKVLTTRTKTLAVSCHGLIACGNRPNGEYLFEPIAGNGHHNQVGASAQAYFLLFNNPLTSEQGILSLTAFLTHSFGCEQHRVFDLKDNPLSRYMLAARYEEGSPQGLSGNGGFSIPFYFAHEYAPVANLTHADVKVSIPYEFECCGLFTYQKDEWGWALGYGVWKQSQEDLCITCISQPLRDQLWALKGDTQMFGFEETTHEPVALSATQSTATLFFGKNFGQSGAITPAQVSAGKENPRINTPIPAYADTNGDMISLQLLTEPLASPAINTSYNPVFITADDINRNSTSNSMFAQKLFGYVRYVGQPHPHYVPFCIFGSQVEFGNRDQYATPYNHEHLNTGITTWTIWINVGATFE